VADYTLLEMRRQAPAAAAPFHEWAFADGTLWTQFFRAGDGYLLRFPGLADFSVSGSTLAVACQPAPGVARDTCDHLYLNQVLPLVLSKQGKLVFHASAVEFEGGALAFLGESGRGKSTLAASFATSGSRFLTDDGLVVEPDNKGFCILPSHPSLRLWRDSREALIAPDARIAPPLSYTDKTRFLAGVRLAFCPQARPLRHAFFLGGGSAAAVAFEPLSAAQALVEWAKHSFLFDPKEKPALASHFNRVATLAGRVRCFRLDYPRRFEELPHLRQAIVQQLREEDVTA